MDEISLYKLPKDILVKMIVNIHELFEREYVNRTFYQVSYGDEYSSDDNDETEFCGMYSSKEKAIQAIYIQLNSIRYVVSDLKKKLRKHSRVHDGVGGYWYIKEIKINSTIL